MFNSNRIFAGARIALLLTLIVGLIGVTPASAQVNGRMAESDTTTNAVPIQTPAYPVPINSGQSKLVPFSIAGTDGISGTITNRTYQFFTQYDVPLSEPFGPFPASVSIDSSGSATWDEPVYLPKEVANRARSSKEYAIVMRSTFHGSLQTGERFRANSSLLLLLPPDAFSKVSPSNGAIVQSGNQALQWNSSVGAVDYEYCFDSIDNDSCDANWTGTYWLGTYDTNAALQNLPPGTTLYWQVRANNTAGTTYADNGDWWEFTTASLPFHVVTKTTDTDDGICDSDCSLREAVNAAVSGDTIIFDASLSGQRVISTQITIDKDLHINGEGLDPSVIISTEEGVAANVFKIMNGATVTLENLKITSSLDSAVYEYLSTLIINRVTFQGNTASAGGAIRMEGGTATITNSTFTENYASGVGGAIFSHIGNLTIKNSTFSGNGAGNGIDPGLGGSNDGSDIYNHTGILHLHNNILANSTAGHNCYTNTNSRPASYINNIIEFPTTASYPCGTSYLEVDPLLGPLADNGGTTETMALLPGSPAIDAGDTATCAITDQRGVTRPQGSGCDIGAYEYVFSPVPTITTTATPTVSITPTSTLTFTPTATLTATHTPTLTRTSTLTPTPALTRTPTVTRTPTRTRTPSRTPSPTRTITSTSTPITPTATHTFTPHPPTITFTPSATATATDVVSAPAEMNKGFSPTIITSGGVSRLSVSIFNPNPFALTNAALTDNLPAGMTIANPASLSNSCGGTVTAVSGGTSVSLTGGSVPAQVGSTPGFCMVAIDVTSTTPGNTTNTIPAGALITDNGVTNSTPASATLTVLPVTATTSATRTATASGKLTKTNTPSRTPSPTRTPTYTLTSTRTHTPTLTPSSTHVTITATWTATPSRTFTPTWTPSPTTSSGFPTTVVRDNFNRANGPIGNTWYGYPSAFSIASNQLDVTASGSNTFILWKSSSFGADQEAYVTLTQIDATPGNEHRLILKSQNSKNVASGLISVVYDAASQTVQVWTYHPTQGWVQHGASISAAFVNGDQFGARARPDGTVEVYRNGMLLGTFNITSWPFYNSGGYVGMWFVNAPNALLDNFGGGTR